MSKIVFKCLLYGTSICTCSLAYNSGNVVINNEFGMMIFITLVATGYLHRLLLGMPVKRNGEDDNSEELITPEVDPLAYSCRRAIIGCLYCASNMIMILIFTANFEALRVLGFDEHGGNDEITLIIPKENNRENQPIDKKGEFSTELPTKEYLQNSEQPLF
jgi:hypothetical protein